MIIVVIVIFLQSLARGSVIPIVAIPVSLIGDFLR